MFHVECVYLQVGVCSGERHGFASFLPSPPSPSPSREHAGIGACFVHVLENFVVVCEQVHVMSCLVMSWMCTCTAVEYTYV